MPQRNVIRHYAEKNFYHVYNRGVEKRLIFNSQADYKFFVSLIDSYLTPKLPLGTTSIQEARNKFLPYWRNKLEKDEIELICYCLMPNHFHLLLKQNSRDAITRFMRRVSNAYVKYFNKKYERVGSLFQGKFKSVLIQNDNYLLHLSRYIHLNPLEVGPLKSYEFSSYLDYIGKRHVDWIHKDIILNFFKNPLSKENSIFVNLNKFPKYLFFVENYKKPSEKILGDLVLEID